MHGPEIRWPIARMHGACTAAGMCKRADIPSFRLRIDCGERVLEKGMMHAAPLPERGIVAEPLATIGQGRLHRFA